MAGSDCFGGLGFDCCYLSLQFWVVFLLDVLFICYARLFVGAGILLRFIVFWRCECFLWLLYVAGARDTVGFVVVFDYFGVYCLLTCVLLQLTFRLLWLIWFGWGWFVNVCFGLLMLLDWCLWLSLLLLCCITYGCFVRCLLCLFLIGCLSALILG